MDLSAKPVLFWGTSYPDLAIEFARRYGIEEGRAQFRRFSDGEINLNLKDPAVFGKDCVVFQTLCDPVQDHLMELFLAGDALKNAGATRISAIIPYLCYMRQDRRTAKQGPISVSLVARLLKAAGYSSIRTWGLHNAATEGIFSNAGLQMFNTQTHINSKQFCHVMTHNMNLKDQRNLVLVSPDAGAAKAVIKLAEGLTHNLSSDMLNSNKMLSLDTAFAYKLRSSEGKVEVLEIAGDVSGKTCVIVDDIIDGGSTVCQVATMLKDKGASRVIGCAIHPVFSGYALEKLMNSPMDKIITAKTIPWWKRSHFTKEGSRITIPKIETEEFSSKVEIQRKGRKPLEIIMRHFRLQRQNSV